MRVRPNGPDGVVVEIPRQQPYALHSTRNMPRPLQPVPTLTLAHQPPPESPGALMQLVAAVPEHLVSSEYALMPDENGIHRPWQEPLGSPILLTDTRSEDISLQRGTAVELLLDPRSLPVSVGGEQLRVAASWVLAHTPAETLIRVALHWAFACEVCHRPWSGNIHSLGFHDLSGPEPNREHLGDKPHRLIEPQVMRVVALDAACSQLTTDRADQPDPALLPTAVRTLVAEFFPCVHTRLPPTHAEVRTALWLLANDSPFDDRGDDAPSMLMAYTFGSRSVGEPQETLQQWMNLVNLDDDHPHGSWDPSEAPSDLRNDLRAANGLDLRDVAAVVDWMLPFMTLMQDEGNQLWTLPSLRTLAANALGESKEPAFAFVAEHLVTTVDQLCESIRSQHPNGQSETDAIARREQIEKQLLHRPLIQFGDGSIVPTNAPDLVYRTISLCQEAHNGQVETKRQRSQRIGRILGHSFEAVVREMCHSLGGTHLVLDRDAVDSVIEHEGGPDAKRADVVLCDADGNYVVIEATKQNLLGGIRYGDGNELAKYIDEHLRKLKQATSTSSHMTAIAVECRTPAPKNVAAIVVADLPLRHDPALASLFDDRSGTRNPPFSCGMTEFARLIALGDRGFSVPTVVLAWQMNSRGRSLGLFLSDSPYV